MTLTQLAHGEPWMTSQQFAAPYGAWHGLKRLPHPEPTRQSTDIEIRNIS